MPATATQPAKTSLAARTGARVLAKWLVRRGIGSVFLVPGLQIDPLFAELCNTPGLQVIMATHELTAGYMADGYARASGQPGVCLSIGAAGAASLVASAVTAKADHSPVLFITGNVPVSMQCSGTFQDGWPGGTDDAELLRRAVGYSGVAHSATNLDEQLDAAFANMFDLPQKPAHLSIPFNIQQERGLATTPAPSQPATTLHDVAASASPLPAEVVQRLARAQRLILLAGSRLNTAQGAVMLRAFAETFNIPVATTLSAKGVLPENHPLNVGNFGYAGSRRANESLLNTATDLLLVLGTDLNERDSLGWNPRLRQRHGFVLRIDSTATTARHPLQPDLEIQADVASVLHRLLTAEEEPLQPLKATATQRTAWIQSLSEIPRTYQVGGSAAPGANTIRLDHLVLALRERLPPETILVVDAGLHRLFAGHFWLSLQANCFFAACGLAPFGWAIAAAIGIKLARPRQPVVVLTGDGCLQAHGNELATMARFGLPILVVVCNNRAYGSIRRRLEHDVRAAALAALPGVNWTQYAESLGCQAVRVEDLARLPQVLAPRMATLSQAHGVPLVLDVNTTGPMTLPAPAAAHAAILGALHRSDSD